MAPQRTSKLFDAQCWTGRLAVSSARADIPPDSGAGADHRLAFGPPARGSGPPTGTGSSRLSRLAVTQVSLEITRRNIKELVPFGIGVAIPCPRCIAYHPNGAVTQDASRMALAGTFAIAIYVGVGPSITYAARPPRPRISSWRRAANPNNWSMDAGVVAIVGVWAWPKSLFFMGYAATSVERGLPRS